jgi:hypothetical protein
MKLKYYVIWYGAIIPEWYRAKIDAMKAFVEYHGHTFILLNCTDFTGTQKEAAILKDRLQFELCCTIPDAAIIDADCDLFGIPELLPGRPYFERLPPNRPHHGYVIVNNCCQFFIDLIAERKEIWNRSVYGFPNKMMRGKQNDVYYIEDSTFKHYMRMNNKEQRE